MRWLADENIPRATIVRLCERGEDVLAITETQPGVPDEQVIAITRETGSTLTSFDRDHDDLVFGWAVRPPQAVIYLRLEPPLPQVLNALLAAVVESGEAVLQGPFMVVTPQGMQQRALTEP